MTKHQDLLNQQYGDYRLIRWIGGGRYGDVYLGQHVQHQTQAAVKVFNVYLTQAQDRQRFLSEVHSRQLEHPHIAALLDAGVGESSLPFLVMEYAARGSFRKRHTRGLQVPLLDILKHLVPIASALQYAHDLQLVHGNLRPENLLLNNNGMVLLSDFSIPSIGSKFNSDSTLSDLERVIPYTAPEQSLGEPGFASDQYALAVIIYELLCGRCPFPGMVTVPATQEELIPPSLREQVPDLSLEVEQVILRALASDPDQRFRGVQEFATALKAVSYPEQTPTAPMPTIALMTKIFPDEEELATLSASREIFPLPADDIFKIPEQEIPEPTDIFPVEEEAARPIYALVPSQAAPPALTTLSQTSIMVQAPRGQRKQFLAIGTVALVLLIIASSMFFVRSVQRVKVSVIPTAVQQGQPEDKPTSIARIHSRSDSSSVKTATPTAKPTTRPVMQPTPTSPPRPTPVPTQKPKPTPTPKPVCPPQVQNGSTGSWVKVLQQELNARGMKDQDGKVLDVDGEFGSRTEYAVKRWQTLQHIEVDGQVGPITWHTLGNC
ncbi:serine/threonine-protein kinase [Ktedonospora formicarum]|uniref:non-specific serine/threonine protein kinase n=1 Tax=Ktedonospora formicarum TaxID=2778364 RepID=A0A8J3MQI2_9CHLR|nr:serine/threonine-protein kinase [Ktedonospora formicarum]GHO42628.1 hypothetical protein KSX_07910 [Ktedonospora formicarum]